MIEQDTQARRAWTTREVALLRQHYGATPMRELQHMLGRGKGSIRSFANRMGLRCPAARHDRPASLDEVRARCLIEMPGARDGDEGCWQWRGRTMNAAPVVQDHASGKRLQVRREVWRLLHGADAPDGHVVVPLADCCPGCVNPRHLRLRTGAQHLKANIALEPAAARSVRMALIARRRARLTPQDVAMIRQSDEPIDSLAKRLGVSKTSIVNVRNYRTWRDYGAGLGCSTP